jgi:molecular chaperone GrpE (heat shock protein)
MKFINILKNRLMKHFNESTSQFEEPKPEADRVSFPELLTSARQLTSQIAMVTLKLDRILLDTEDYGVESWKREMEFKKKYIRVLDSLFILLDHLENLTMVEEKSNEIDWLFKRIHRILEDEAIEEIQVSKGKRFNGRYHKQVESRSDELPKDAVLEISRKGYFIRGKPGQSDAILRSAEVIISNGPLEKQPELRNSDKVGK